MKKILLILFTISISFGALGFQEIRDVALTVDGKEIPIVIYLPDSDKDCKRPVNFHVHGGGWNGGSESVVPEANVPYYASLLCDELGIIQVGLAYRCKNQNGTFEKAISDLKASIKWFKKRAKKYNADMSNIAFSGGSAGTPLSSMLAQMYKSCKIYVGLWGVYDFLDNESLFPDEKARSIYGLGNEELMRKYSAYHNIRKKPAATILLHGNKDILTTPSQTVKFAKKLKEQGAEVEYEIYPDVNHNFLGPTNPEEFKDGTNLIIKFYIKHFNLKEIKWNEIDSKIKQAAEKNYPVDELSIDQLIGSWKRKNETLVLEKNGEGKITKQNQKDEAITFDAYSNYFEVVRGNEKVKYFLRKNQNMIYYIENDERHAGMKRDFRKQ